MEPAGWATRWTAKLPFRSIVFLSAHILLMDRTIDAIDDLRAIAKKAMTSRNARREQVVGHRPFGSNHYIDHVTKHWEIIRIIEAPCVRLMG